MLSLAKAHKDYYLQKLGEITPREDYYLRGGYATGRWHGSGAAELGLKGAVTAEGLVRLFDGQDPATGEQLGRQLRKDGVAAWDLTFSADKSVSLLWAFGDAETRCHVLEAFEEATGEAVAYLESMASSTRGASRTPVVDDDGTPVLRDDGSPRYRVETWPIRTKGYVAAWFTEFTSRADDPQLHTHVVVGNRVKGVDGCWRAIDGRLLYRHKMAAGYVHEAELRSRLTERLGVRWQPVRNGVADIEGFPRDQIMAFSQRRREIEEWRDEHGLPDTAAANEVATLATRNPKHDHPLTTLMPQWLKRAEDVGLTPETVSAVLNRSRNVTIPDLESLFSDMVSADGLTAQASTFERADVVRSAAEALPEGGTREHIEALADTFLHRSEIVPILPTQPVYASVSDLLVELTPAQLERLLELSGPTKQARTMRRRNGDIFPGLIHERRYTTAELLTIEQRIIERGRTGIDAGRWTAPVTEVERALSRDTQLTQGQRAMVHQFATSGNAIEVGVGAAGSGKTTVMTIIRRLASQDGTPLIGTALAARAASGFATATGIPASTLTRLLWEAKEAGGLPSGAIVVVDEAGMVGSRQLAAISDLVEAASGKLILIGDHHQLAEIDAGGLFAALTMRLPAVELTENVRQSEAWERTALAELRHGSVHRAIAMYYQRGRIHVGDSNDDTLSQALDNWHQDIQATGSLAEVLLIGHRNTTVDQLNHRARGIIAKAGLLQGATLNVNGRRFQAGDRVVCLKNRPKLSVLNGDLATVISVDVENGTIAIRLDRHGQRVTVPGWYLDKGYVDWGYALTGHKAQGTTARRVHTVVDGSVDREWIYVTMSRGQESNTIYVSEPEGGSDQCMHVAHNHTDRLPALISALGRRAAEPAAVDTGRGPQAVTDAQLSQRIAALEAQLFMVDGRRRSRRLEFREKSLLVDYVKALREAEARHRDKLAVVGYEPPAWISLRLGERPAGLDRRAVWDAEVDRILRDRADYVMASRESRELSR